MSAFQWLTKQFVPAQTYAAMEAESRQWVMECPCGHVTSIWEMGGVRYRAAGEPVRAGWCAGCRKRFTGPVRKLTSTSEPTA
jgi:hypothetical protein